MDTRALDSYLSQSDEDAHPEWFADDEDAHPGWFADEVASEFNFGFGGDPTERDRPYAYRDGACVECGCADGGHYGDCQAAN